MVRRPRQWWLVASILALLVVGGVGLMAGDPSPQDRAYAIDQRLRCPVCKNVAIAFSASETAASARRIVEEQVKAGRTDEEIIGYFTARYGQWILLDPPMQGRTLILWILPIAVAGGAVLLVVIRTRRITRDSMDLPDADRLRVHAALQEYRQRAEEDDEP